MPPSLPELALPQGTWTHLVLWDFGLFVYYFNFFLTTGFLYSVYECCQSSCLQLLPPSQLKTPFFDHSFSSRYHLFFLLETVWLVWVFKRLLWLCCWEGSHRRQKSEGEGCWIQVVLLARRQRLTDIEGVELPRLWTQICSNQERDRGIHDPHGLMEWRQNQDQVLWRR